MKKVFGIILTMTGIITVILSVILKVKGQLSVSVIGGADGPTSVFVAGKVGGAGTAAGILVGIMLLAAGIVLFVKKHG